MGLHTGFTDNSRRYRTSRLAWYHLRVLQSDVWNRHAAVAVASPGFFGMAWSVIYVLRQSDVLCHCANAGARQVSPANDQAVTYFMTPSRVQPIVRSSQCELRITGGEGHDLASGFRGAPGGGAEQHAEVLAPACAFAFSADHARNATRQRRIVLQMFKKGDSVASCGFRFISIPELVRRRIIYTATQCYRHYQQRRTLTFFSNILCIRC